MADPLLGTSIGRYRLTQLLGEGGMGRVYAATHDAIGSVVAIKVMSDHNGELVDRFFAEARAVNLVAHDAIVKATDLAYLPDGRPYIVMELVTGQTLRSLIRGDGYLPVGGVIDVMVEVLSALGAVHAAGIVHRDLKPDNIMVTPKGRVRVLDFGIAKLTSGHRDGLPRTQTGARIGTPEYMAPEQIRGTTVDARTDIYAIGVMLFEAITRQRPFIADSEFELLRAHLETPPRSVGELRPGLGHELDDVIAQALAKAPEQRFLSAKAMANALGAARAALPADQRKRIAVRADAPLPTAVTTGPATANERPTARRDHPQPTPSLAQTTPDRPSRARTWVPVVVAAALAAAAATSIVLVARPSTQTPTPTPTIADRQPTPQPTPPTPTPTPTPTPSPSPPEPIPTPTRPPRTPTSRKPLEVPTSPGSFDPEATLRRATSQARQLAPDAALVELVLPSVRPDGLALSPPSGAAFVFRSEAGISDSGRKVHCVSIAGGSGTLLQVLDPTDHCLPQTPGVPRCTVAEIWARGSSPAPSPTDTAMIIWLANGWQFQRTIDRRPVSRHFDDDCGQRAAPKPVADDDGGVVTTPAGGAFPETTYPNHIADPTHFDAIAYIPTAVRLGRKLFPDAVLVSMLLSSVHTDGHVDLTHADVHGNGQDRYVLFSPDHGVMNPMVTDLCTIVVEVTAKTTTVLLGKGSCHYKLGSPRCSLAAVWTQMSAAFPNLSETGVFEWRPDQWAVDSVTTDRLGRKAKKFPDDCPQAK